MTVYFNMLSIIFNKYRGAIKGRIWSKNTFHLESNSLKRATRDKHAVT